MLGLVVSSACVQSESVGSDTGRDGDGDGGGDAVCEDIDTTGEPFPNSCTPSSEDHPCLQCIKLICCSELLSCPSFEACVCQVECAEMGAPPAVCNDSCAGTPGGCDLSGCGELECEQVCVGAG